MRRLRSSGDVNTTARPRWVSSSGEAAACLMTAPAGRQTAAHNCQAAFGRQRLCPAGDGIVPPLVYGDGRQVFADGAAGYGAFIEVATAAPGSFITTGTPPASKNRSIWY